MRLIEQSVKLVSQDEKLDGVYKQIEEIARTCYKSEDKIKEDSAQSFINRLIDSKHFAMLEHGTVYLKIPNEIADEEVIEAYLNNPYSRVRDVIIENKGYWYITTNFRVIVENGWYNDLFEYQCEPEEYHHKRVSVKCTTSIGVARELCRHRVFSFAQESTRYCNYSKDKFGNEITFIIPSWVKLNPGPYEYNSNGEFEGDGYIDDIISNTPESKLLWLLSEVEDTYKDLTENKKLQAQEARDILPLCTKTEIVMTGFEDQWHDFFDVRLNESTGKVHPDMKALAKLIYDTINDSNSNK